MNTKADLIRELTDHTYVRLLPSATHGIGVFAIRDIPKGCRNIFSDDPGTWIELSFDEVARLPAGSRDLVENFCLYDAMQYFIPAHGFKNIDLSLFLNHSDQPNIISIEDGRFFETIRDIAIGEELFVDYGTIVD